MATERKESAGFEKDTEKSITEPIEIGSGAATVAKILEHSKDADEALTAFASHQGEVIHVDEETNQRLLRKIDRNIMPVRLLLTRHCYT
jgi:ACS family allantoate permease-like MFS transporter